MCDAVGSIWLIGADGTGEVSSICFYGLLFERWPQQFFMITLDLDASKRNFLNKKLGQLGHPFDSPIQQQVPQLQDLFPSKESQYQIQSSLVRAGVVCYLAMEFNALRRAGSSLAEHTDAKTAKAMCCRGVWLISVKILFRDGQNIDTW